MKENETIKEYFGRVLVVETDMSNIGEEMTDNKIVEKILRSLSEKFTYVVCSIEESNDTESFSVDALESSLLSHEQNIMKHAKRAGSCDQALKVTAEVNGGGTRGRGRGDSSRGRGNGGRGRGDSSRGRGNGGRGRGKFNKELVECYHCHKLGHFQN